MMNQCAHCGASLQPGVKFCENCGTAVTMAQPAVPNAYMQAAQAGIPAPGYSARVNDPEILAAMKKNRKAAAIFAFIIVPLPLLGFWIYSMVSDKMEPQQALIIGGIISAIFLLFAFYGLLKQKVQKPYEGVVTGHKTKLRYRSGNDGAHTDSYTEYITYVKTSEGKKKKIVEKSTGIVTAYYYLTDGARFRFHPQFHFPYELYDKAQAPYIACVSCGTQNDITADHCKKCNIPLLK